MAEVRAFSMQDWRVLREIRLAALRDAPSAFASTYESEAAFAEADWQRFIAGGGSFAAYARGVDTVPVGIVGAFEAEPGTVELVAMWVRPQARREGVGAALVQAVMEWASAKGAARVHLWVTESNSAARRLYERCGFAPTGERQPLPSAPQLTLIGLQRAP